MRNRCLARGFLVSAVVAISLSAAPVAAQYVITPILMSGNIYDPESFDVPVLNNAGQVAVLVSLADGTDQILRFTAGIPTIIAEEEPDPPRTGGLLRFGSLSINGRGQVGFEASISVPDGAEGIFRGGGGPTTLVAGTRGAGSFDFVNAGPQINSAGNVAFIGERIVGAAFIDGVWVGNGGLRSIYDSTGPFDNFIGNPSLNDSGEPANILRETEPNDEKSEPTPPTSGRTPSCSFKGPPAMIVTAISWSFDRLSPGD